MTDKQTKAPCLAVLGTGSDVGKSILVTALCKLLTDKGYSVVPYKAQNMSNNSGVTPEGLEMGRAQIVQAEACGIPPHVDMNPVLLKPTSDVGSQVVLMGNAVYNSSAASYHEKKETLFKTAADALDRLRETHDVVVMEGAGSCAEVNLMAHDIVNFRMAHYADASVILAADIHRGGVFAQIIGTFACLEEKEKSRIIGSIINRFRGDISLFQDGIDWIEKRGGKPVFGVLPWFDDFAIEAEDSVVIENPPVRSIPSNSGPAVGIIRIPHISNFTDFDALSAVDGLSVYYLEKPCAVDGLAAVILPGSKNTRNDLNWLHETGWTKRIMDYKGHVLGICGGYQMLGETVADPDGLEGAPGNTKGLGLLPMKTTLQAPKTTTRTRFSWDVADGEGYEIHMGQTVTIGDDKGCIPPLRVWEQNGEACDKTDGAINKNGNVLGTYIHGFFDSTDVLDKWLALVGLTGLKAPEELGLPARTKAYEKLAAHFEKHVNVDAVFRHLGL